MMPTSEGLKPYTVHRVLPGFCMMWVAGVLSGLLGIGSGAFKVVAMDQIMRIPFKVTTATSNFMIGVTAAASVGVYLKRGYLDPSLVAPVALGVLAGAFIGAKLLPVAPVKLLKDNFPDRRFPHWRADDREWDGLDIQVSEPSTLNSHSIAHMTRQRTNNCFAPRFQFSSGYSWEFSLAISSIGSVCQ